jgi:hypothetical protein
MYFSRRKLSFLGKNNLDQPIPAKDGDKLTEINMKESRYVESK